MFCGKCGNEIADNAKFCSKCGAVLGSNENRTIDTVNTNNSINSTVTVDPINQSSFVFTEKKWKFRNFGHHARSLIGIFMSGEVVIAATESLIDINEETYFSYKSNQLEYNNISNIATKKTVGGVGIVYLLCALLFYIIAILCIDEDAFILLFLIGIIFTLAGLLYIVRHNLIITKTDGSTLKIKLKKLKKIEQVSAQELIAVVEERKKSL